MAFSHGNQYSGVLHSATFGSKVCLSKDFWQDSRENCTKKFLNCKVSFFMQHFQRILRSNGKRGGKIKQE